jgi:hypothetical protein
MLRAVFSSRQGCLAQIQSSLGQMPPWPIEMGEGGMTGEPRSAFLVETIITLPDGCGSDIPKRSMPE